MTAYNFKARFVAPILAGTKRQTIRKPRTGRSRHVRPGEEIQLYTGMRTRHCKLIGRAICERVIDVQLRLVDTGHTEGVTRFNAGDPRFSAWPRHKRELNDFARQDGFKDWAALKAFWAEHHRGVETFDGVLISWRAIR